MDDRQNRTWGNPHQRFSGRSKQDCFNATAWISTHNEKVRARAFGFLHDLFGSVPSANYLLDAASAADAWLSFRTAKISATGSPSFRTAERLTDAGRCSLTYASR